VSVSRLALLFVAILTQACRSSAAYDPQACSPQQTAADTLRIDDGWVYVEPQALTESAGTLGLFGSPAYITAPGAAPLLREDLVGVVYSSASRENTLPVWAPEAVGRPGMIRAVPTSGGRWEVILAQMTDESNLIDRHVLRLFAGVYGHGRWTEVVEIKLPPEMNLRWLNASDLVRDSPGNLAFAVPVDTRDGGRDVVLFTRRREKWAYTPLHADQAAYAAVGLTPQDEVVIAVVRPDDTLPVDTNSLFLHFGSEGWKGRRVVTGGNTPIHEPTIAATDSGMVVSFWVRVQDRREARAYYTAFDTTIVLDSSVDQLDVVNARDRPFWIAQARLEADGHPELRFVVGTRELGTRMIGRVPSHFQGTFGSWYSVDGRIRLFGPALIEAGKEVVLATLQVSYIISCRDGLSSHAH
jgi:hypothetical protein